MRTLIFLFALLAMNCFAAPQPNVRINPWSTNDWPDPVKGTNSLSVSNTIPGGSLWNFYGTNAQTVARLGDVLSSQVWTNDGTFIRPSGPTNQGIFIRRDGSIYIGTNTYQDVNMFNFGRVNPIWATTLVSSNEPNDQYSQIGVIDNESDFNFFSFWSLDVKADGPANVGYAYQTYNAHITNGHESLVKVLANPSSGSYFKIFEDKNDGLGSVERAIMAPSDSDPYVWDTDSFRTNGAIEYTRNFGTNIFQVFWDGRIQAEGGATILGPQTNSGTMDVADDLTAYGALIAVNGFTVSSGISSFNTGIKLNALTAGRLAAITTAGYLTNSVYSDADIAALQAATNNFIRDMTGKGTNTLMISPTNQPSASNQVATTFNGLAGQATNIWEVRSNGVLIASISRDGSFTNLAAASFASGHFTIGTDGTVIDNNGNLSLSSAGAILAINSVGYTSPSTTEANIYGSGFTALATLYLGSRTSNTHAIVLANTPPGYIFRDGLKSSNCPVTVGTLISSNNFIPGTNSDMITAYFPFSGTKAFRVLPSGNLAMATNISFESPIAGMVIYARSNYDTYAITPTKTNLFAVGQ